MVSASLVLQDGAPVLVRFTNGSCSECGGGTCVVDGAVASSCASALALVHAGAAGFANVPGYTFNSGTGCYTARETTGGDPSICGVVLFQRNEDRSWLNTFFAAIPRSFGRSQGQSFSECVNENIRLLTANSVDPEKLFDPVLAQVEGLAIAGTTTRVSSYNLGAVGLKEGARPVALLTAVARLGAAALGMSGRVRTLTVITVVSGGRAFAIAGAAARGVGIGSSANCAATGTRQ